MSFDEEMYYAGSLARDYRDDFLGLVVGRSIAHCRLAADDAMEWLKCCKGHCTPRFNTSTYEMTFRGGGRVLFRTPHNLVDGVQGLSIQHVVYLHDPSIEMMRSIAAQVRSHVIPEDKWRTRHTDL